MSGNLLTGFIPPELGNLANLDLLDLGLLLTGFDDEGNYIEIAFPNLLSGPIPPEIGNLTKLEGLFLASNAFEGELPAGIANLTLLGSLFLNCNNFEGVPSLPGLANLESLLVENNRLTFADIEPNVGRASGMYSYSPQAPIPVTVTPVGDDLVLSVVDDSPNNRFQWFLGGSPIAGADGPSHTISVSDPNGPDAYHVEVTNTVAVDLTLSSRSSLSKIIVNDDGDEPDAMLSDGVCDVDLQTAGSQCTFYAAIQIVNQAASQSCGSSGYEIAFDGVDYVEPGANLPAITKSVLINGGSGGARVELNGSAAGAADGLMLQGQDVTIRNLRITGFNGWGIRVNGGSGHVVENSRIGVLSEGTTNAAGGVLIEGDARDVTIGGLQEAQENIIGGGVRILGSDTRGVRVLRNLLEIREEALSTYPLSVPLDLGGDGPTCMPWAAGEPTGPNAGMPPPRVLALTEASLRGMTRPGSTVIVYIVEATGINLGRYWARSVQPAGVGVADASGEVFVDFDFPLGAGTQIALTATDPSGNTSELSQIRRPVIYLPGVGGSWLRGAEGDHLFIPPIAAPDYVIRRRLDRLALNPDGVTSANGETIRVDGIVEQNPLPYHAVLAHLEARGFTGNPDNVSKSTLDLWRFSYDWRLDPVLVADDLESLIDNITSLTEDVAAACEVDVVTHSNGGMVASAYVWKSREHSRDHVNTLLMSAAPYWGTPQVAAAHTRGYLFDFENLIFDSPAIDIDYGRLVRVFQNLPDGYGLLPSKAFMEAIDPDAPQQNDWYLTDLFGRPLHGYDATFGFMTGPKTGDQIADPPGPGLGRNGEMWSGIQTAMHDVMNDWRAYDGPPHVFRQVGRRPLSTALSWRVPPSLNPVPPANSWRREQGDTDRHVAYREATQARMGWGDGTVALVSATLGRGRTREKTRVGRAAFDYSGVEESEWIEEFEYFDCTHTGMVAPTCVDDDPDDGRVVNALERTTDVLKSKYEIVVPGPGKAQSAVPSETDVFYVLASGPVRVSIEDEFGHRNGPDPGGPISSLAFGLPEVGYWPSALGAVVSIPSGRAYTLLIEADAKPIFVRAFRARSDGDGAANTLFDDVNLGPHGGMRFELEAVGTPGNVPFSVDTDGNGSFEGLLSPAAELVSDEAGPVVPEAYPFLLFSDIEVGSGDPVLDLTIPDAGGPAWDFVLEDVPAWVVPDAVSGQSGSVVGLTLAASTLSSGLHRDTLAVVVENGGFSARTRIPVELVVRDGPSELAAINVYLDRAQVAVRDTATAWAVGLDQYSLPTAVDAVWSATGGTIDDNGVYVAGPSPGIYIVRAETQDGQIRGTVEIEVIGGVAVDEDEPLPTAFRLYPNYPNPFNPETTIRFDLPSRAAVQLIVYDLLGREVAVLFDGNLAPGRHGVRFSGGRYPSGVYLYRVTAGGRSESGKMILLK